MSQSDSATATDDRKAGESLRDSKRPAALPGTSYINKLPTELLRDCFELAIDRPASLNSQDYRPSAAKAAAAAAEADLALRRQACKSAWSIGLTCKSFYAITTPILYSRIELIPPTWRDEPRTDRSSVCFISTMNTAPATRELVKSLSISTHHFSQINTVPSREKLDFTRLTRVSLAVIHGWSTEEWNVCCTNLCNLPVLSELHIDLQLRCESGFRPVYRLLEQLPHLSTLTLGGVCGDDDSREVFEWESDRTELEVDQGGLASQVCQGSWHAISKLIHVPVHEWLRVLHPASLVVPWPYRPRRTSTLAIATRISRDADPRYIGNVRLLSRRPSRTWISLLRLDV
jgi:hypothetical protein